MTPDSTQWLTPEAHDSLEKWMARCSSFWEKEGVEAKEIRSDLEAKLRGSRQSEDELVTVEEVEAAISEMGLPSLLTKDEADRDDWGKAWLNAPPVGLEPKEKWRTAFKAFFKARFFAGAWPLMMVLLELATGVLSVTFFDPVSRVPQIVLLLAVTLIGAMVTMDYFGIRDRKLMVFLRGAAAVTAAYYSIFMLTIIGMAAFVYGTGVIYSFGFLLIIFPIFFICVLMAAAPIFLFLGLLRRIDFQTFKTSWLGGFLFGVVILLVVEGPAYLSRYGAKYDKVSLVRSFGSEDTLHLICYEGSLGNRSFTDTSGFLLHLGFIDFFGGNSVRKIDYPRNREFHYRVTGRSPDANELKVFYGPSRGRGTVVWDENPGGDGVSARIRGLDLATSRLDGHLDSASRLGYWEWTMEFSNTSFQEQEARMQLLLPPGGVVSRLSLWVNGEAQEAAFSRTAKVTKAYKEIAVHQRRDPVLVRWIGADRVMVQCFPVLTSEKMKIRVGVTAPLDEKGRFFLPRIIEKNFGIDEAIKTSMWVQGDMEMVLEGLRGGSALGRWRETHGTLSALDLMDKHTFVQSFPKEQAEVIWTRDPFAEADQEIVVRTQKRRSESSMSEKIVLIIDGSGYFSEWAGATQEAISDLKDDGHEVVVFVAAEENVIEDPESLSDVDFEGGQDSVAAFEAALSEVSGSGKTKLIWMHGQLPINLSSSESLVQRLERGSFEVDFSVIDLDGGPNRLLEKIARVLPLRSSGRPSSPGELTSELKRVVQGNDDVERWEQVDESGIPDEAVEVWDQLARWRVWQEVSQASGDSKDLATMAAKYQLVSPVSGAVVLETKDQYEQFGLKQIDPDASPSIPTIPEPSIALLGLLSMGMMWRRRRPGHY